MRELLGKTRFGDFVFLFWEKRKGSRYYFDVSRFVDPERNYDVYALMSGLFSFFVQRQGKWNDKNMSGIVDVFEISLFRIPKTDFSAAAAALGHCISVDAAKYGRTLLHPAFQVR